jgi:hypothetical protein
MWLSAPRTHSLSGYVWGGEFTTFWDLLSPREEDQGLDAPEEVETLCIHQGGVVMRPGVVMWLLFSSIAHLSENGSFSSGQNQVICPSAEKSLL